MAHYRRTLDYLRLVICFLFVWLLYVMFIFQETVEQCARDRQESGKQDRTSQAVERKTKHYALQHGRIENNIEEFWLYVQSEVGQLKSDVVKSLNNDTSDKDSVAKQAAMQRILDMTSQFKRSLLTDMQTLQTLEGGERQASKQNKRLSELVQARLRYIQNPLDCSAARKVRCKIDWPCGFGCQLHHAAYCLIIAYATNRTLVLNSDSWRYNSAGWEDVFEPLSETCTTASEDDVTYWPNYDPTKQVLQLSQQTYLLKGTGFVPRSVPKDLADRLVHGEPIVWWVGQIVAYIFRPNARLRTILSAHAQRIQFARPIVGVHIRRTDKVGSEAMQHSVHEYMTHVEEYYEQLSLSEDYVERKVYLATDDQQVIDQIRHSYSNYTVLGDESIAHSASLDTRYSRHGLMGIITDLYFLAQSDYLVCTFSSQIGRLAYELLNTRHPPHDASLRYKSLDDIWFFAGQLDNTQLAVEDHIPAGQGQIEIRAGDVLRPTGNHWNGFCRGTNDRTDETGLYPAFKVKSRVEEYDGFPTYPEVELPPE